MSGNFILAQEKLTIGKKVTETQPRSQGFLLKDCSNLREKPWEPGLGKQ